MAMASFLITQKLGQTQKVQMMKVTTNANPKFAHKTDQSHDHHKDKQNHSQGSAPFSP
jgi:hypothetical protein